MLIIIIIINIRDHIMKLGSCHRTVVLQEWPILSPKRPVTVTKTDSDDGK